MLVMNIALRNGGIRCYVAVAHFFCAVVSCFLVPIGYKYSAGIIA